MGKLDNSLEFKGYEDCKKCNGTGYIKAYAHVVGGQCFVCEGAGSIAKMEENKDKAKVRNIIDLKNTIATIEDSMINSRIKSPSIQANRQKQIDEYKKILKELE